MTPGDGLAIAVVGAGVVGIASALALQAEGHRVALIDPEPPGSGASFGNAGGITTCAVVPTASLALLRGLPRMLTDPLSPLAIRWRHLPTLAPWLIRFALAARPAEVERLSLALADLHGECLPAWLDLMADTGTADLLERRGLLYVYLSAAAHARAKPAHDLRRRRGCRVETLGPAEIREIEPALTHEAKIGEFVPDCAHVTSPGILTRRLAEVFAARGGTVATAQATGFSGFRESGPRQVITDRGPVPCDRVVIAAGAYSRPLARMLGTRVPLESERGYHAHVADPGFAPRAHMLAGDGGFAVTPMSDGLRLAGTVELASRDAAPDYDRARILIGQARRLFPDLRGSRATLWMGRRPSLPDSLPVIGPAPRAPGAVFAFGHGHQGLTLAAVTARAVAALIAGRAPPFDPRPFGADRF